ncbi:MAG: class I SAM-dependent methyltransferase, partial [Candidatus Omnitrophica bacterium]|nr:class I SAM-dependent methyltransferase [Candidatus Omnitrophota bacterium]
MQGKIWLGNIHIGHKLTAITVCALFIFNPLSYGTPLDASFGSNPHLIHIPEQWGRVEESFKGTCDKTIIFIQDAHSSLEAQENIAKIIHYLVREKGVTTVFEEGYEGPVPTDEFFGFIRDPSVKQKVSYFFLDKLRIGGAEYAHINRTQDFKLIGADKVKLHQENIRWYQKSAEIRKDTEEDLNTILTETANLAKRNLPKPLTTWLKAKELFEQNKIDLIHYLKRAAELYLKSSTQDAFSLAYPLLTLILLGETTKQKDALDKLQSIDSKDLFAELESLEEDFARRYLDSDRDRELFRHHKNLRLLKRLNQIEITQQEFEAMKDTIRRFKTQDLARFLARETSRAMMFSKLWEKTIQNAVNFYRTAYERDKAIGSCLDEYTRAQNEKMAVLVFGGFHKTNIKEILKERGFSYCIVSPRMTSIDTQHEDYYKRLMSVGYHPFEMSRHLSKASRPAPEFVLPQGRDEVKAVYRIILKRPNESRELLHRRIEEELLRASEGGGSSQLISSKRAEVRESVKEPFPFESPETPRFEDHPGTGGLPEWIFAQTLLKDREQDYGKRRNVLRPIFSEELWKPILEGLDVSEGAQTRILDIGSGTAFEMESFPSPLRKFVWLLDMSGELLRAAQRMFPGVHTIRHDWFYTDLPDASFDAIVGFDMITILRDGWSDESDLREFYLEMKRILKPGGKMIFLSELEPKWPGLTYEEARHLKNTDVARIEKFLEAQRRILKDLGFNVTHTFIRHENLTRQAADMVIPMYGFRAQLPATSTPAEPAKLERSEARGDWKSLSVLHPFDPETRVRARELQDFVEANEFRFGELEDGSVHLPTPYPELVQAFKDMETSAGSLEGKHLLDFGAGDLRVSLVAANLFKMKVTACEKNEHVHLKAIPNLEAAIQGKFVREGDIQFLPPQDGLDLPWKDFDVVFFFYTEPDSISEAEQFRARFRQNVAAMKPGSLAAIAFTEEQLASRLDEALGLETVSQKYDENPIALSPDYYLMLYTVGGKEAGKIQDGRTPRSDRSETRDEVNDSQAMPQRSPEECRSLFINAKSDEGKTTALGDW